MHKSLSAKKLALHEETTILIKVQSIASIPFLKASR